MLDGLLAKVRLIHESLGGDRSEAIQSAAAKGDKFAELRIQTEVKLHEIAKAQDERDNICSVHGPNSPDVLKLKYRLRGSIGELHALIDELRKALEQQRRSPDVLLRQKYNELDLAAKANKVDLLRRQLRDAEFREGGGELPLPQKPRYADWRKDREQLSGDGNEIGRSKDLSDLEMGAQKRWQEEILYQDEVAEKIGENAGILKQHAHAIGDALDSHMNKIDAVEAVVDKANKELETSTKKAKRILQRVREGDKFCVTLVLLLILIGLATVAFNMFTG